MHDTLEPRFVFIFDLDGLLINTSPYHYKAWKKITPRFGFEFTESFNEELKGFNRLQSLDKILAKANIKLTETEKHNLSEEKNELYLSLIQNMNESDLMPGAEEFIKEAVRIKIPLAIGSGSKNAMTLLNKTGLIKYFNLIIDGNMISKPKPDPEIFLSIAQKLNIPIKRCIVFEDSASGITAAKKAGMYVVGIGDAAHLEDADLVFNSFKNVRAHEIANWFSII